MRTSPLKSIARMPVPAFVCEVYCVFGFDVLRLASAVAMGFLSVVVGFFVFLSVGTTALESLLFQKHVGATWDSELGRTGCSLPLSSEFHTDCKPAPVRH